MLLNVWRERQSEHFYPLLPVLPVTPGLSLLCVSAPLLRTLGISGRAPAGVEHEPTEAAEESTQ